MPYLIPVHVREEAPRVPADRHHEGGRFDPGRALELWQSQYTAVLYVVDTAGVPMTPPAQILHSGLALGLGRARAYSCGLILTRPAAG